MLGNNNASGLVAASVLLISTAALAQSMGEKTGVNSTLDIAPSLVICPTET
jgi:hypothetical protein